MKHCMVDLETLGTETDSVFLSIAAVQFDLQGGIGKEFVINIELNSALRMGRKITASTLQWWLEQKPEILKKMFQTPFELDEGLDLFRQWWEENNLIFSWGNSASFDLGLLGHAYHKAGLERPWKFYNERCYRSVFETCLLKHEPKPKDAHDPLVDCYYQIKELCRAMKLRDLNYPQ